MTDADTRQRISVSSILFDRRNAPANPAAMPVLVAVWCILLALVCWLVLAGSTSNWGHVWQYRGTFWAGWLVTVAISVVALVASTLLGLAVALSRRAAFLPLRAFMAVYVEVFRGTPFLVQLLFGYYSLANAFGIDDRLISGTIILTLFSGAYISEMFRAAIAGVPATQLESARAIGLTPAQTFRFVVLPQAAQQVLPPLAGQSASIIKDSSLLSILGIAEFTLSAQQVNSATYSTLESYLPLAVGYLILTLPISVLSRYLEKRFRYET